MKSLTVYSKKTLEIFRVFIFIAIIILLISNIKRFLNTNLLDIQNNKAELVTFTINSILIILFTVLLFIPHKFELCAIAAFIYSFYIIIYEPENIMGFFLFFLGISFLYARGFFNNNQKLKNTIVSAILVGLILTELRFGISIFLDSLFNKAALSFVYFVSLFFINEHISNIVDESQGELVLNIAKYENLTFRDAEWLVEIIKGSKYEKIAIESKMSLGSVKNRFKIIFDELCVGDKRGFLNKYSAFDIYYKDELIPKE